MKKLCKECPERDYCQEPCLESLAEEHLVRDTDDYIKTKYVANPQPLMSYKESRLHKKKHPWNRKGDDHA